MLREHLFVLRFEGNRGMHDFRRQGPVGTQELRQAGWRDVPARVAPARRSCEQPRRPERLRAWPARFQVIEYITHVAAGPLNAYANTAWRGI